MLETWDADTLTTRVKSMLVHFEQLERILISDYECFGQNNTQQIEINNTQKVATLEHINAIIHSFPHRASNDSTEYFLAQIERQLSEMDTRTQHEVSQLLIKLKQTILSCEQRVAINSNIVYSTLNHIKNIWDGLISDKVGMDCVYDSKGQTQK
mgnify:CR=1 FL=1